MTRATKTVIRRGRERRKAINKAKRKMSLISQKLKKDHEAAQKKFGTKNK